MNNIEWIKAVIELCIRIYDRNVEENKEQFWGLEQIYRNYSPDEKSKIEEILFSQFESRDLIYVFSICEAFMKESVFAEYFYRAVMALEYQDFTEGAVYELQVTCMMGEAFNKRKMLHQKNAALVKQRYGIKKWIPIREREKNRIVIVTEMLGGLRHAPTRIVLEFCHTLLKDYRYELVVFVCPTDKKLDLSQVYVLSTRTVISDTRMTNHQWNRLEYKNNEIPIKQISMEYESCIDDYGNMFNFIYEYNPAFVLALGAINPVFDYINTFTTLVEQTFTINCPLSEASILIRNEKREEIIEKQYRELTVGQQHIFLKHKLPVLYDTDDTGETREDNGLPSDKFLVAIVGNRFDIEIDDEFISVLKKILENNSDICLAIIGKVSGVKERLAEDIFKERVYYLGYKNSLFSVYKILNLYLNPKRLGGGWSAGIALAASLPVVTLPNCDVASNVDSRFWVADYQEMIDRVGRLAGDEEYYQETRRYILDNCQKVPEKEMKDYLYEYMDSIQMCLEKMSDK